MNRQCGVPPNRRRVCGGIRRPGFAVPGTGAKLASWFNGAACVPTLRWSHCPVEQDGRLPTRLIRRIVVRSAVPGVREGAGARRSACRCTGLPLTLEKHLWLHLSRSTAL